MAVTMNDVRARLDPEEVDYTSAARLGAEALPLLAELVRGNDTMLASKAAYLASLIPGEERLPVLGAAAASPHPRVRVAAATGLRNLDEADADALAQRLLRDEDVGVRKQSVRAAAVFSSPVLTERIRQIAQDDPEIALRHIAAASLDRG
ncbi:HEAT repeat-containing protein [Parafrankia irregularis]|uniref:HEAT repeat-containing protein n=1 Tax=Parafrankia irregularis TaxID=795642 RepID=A0A0S4QIG4_9ACTN|nr:MULTISPECIES: HEAT repeat domain-containing protein [Parafrankia]MBE3200718.1 HEAT repeat domain-containing protein [Parafrankia sp. CH37]CUU54898.1 HEAT repeat-containing protein [Parafrankia irregularis]